MADISSYLSSMRNFLQGFWLGEDGIVFWLVDDRL
jgi:hypothetical protein